jgi:serine/threonine-protein phosphatase 2A regulatory subunit A
VKELANDSSQFVRAALAGVVMELAPQLGKQPTIEHLVPVFLNLLRDPYPDVRLNVISKLDQVRQDANLISSKLQLLCCIVHLTR